MTPPCWAPLFTHTDLPKAPVLTRLMVQVNSSQQRCPPTTSPLFSSQGPVKLMSQVWSPGQVLHMQFFLLEPSDSFPSQQSLPGTYAGTRSLLVSFCKQAGELRNSSDSRVMSKEEKPITSDHIELLTHTLFPKISGFVRVLRAGSWRQQIRAGGCNQQVQGGGHKPGAGGSQCKEMGQRK